MGLPAFSAEDVEPRSVKFSALAAEQLLSLEVEKSLQVFAGDAARMRLALEQVLSVDVGRPPRKMPYILLFDGLAVELIVSESGDTEVQSVHVHDREAARPLATEPEEDFREQDCEI